MANEQTVIKQGYLHKWRNEGDSKKSSWQPLFFVLHGTSPKNAARLDWYDTQEQYLQSPGMRKALFIEEIKNCTQISCTQESKELYGPSAKYLLMIQTYRTSVPDYVLKCSTQELLTDWHRQLNSLLKHVHTMSKAIRTAIPDKPLDSSDIYNPNVFGSSSYEVQVDDTAAAVRCELQGVYRLLLSEKHITLADPDTGNPVITWMYKHIRRFGYCDKSLTIEGGMRSGFGHGLFIFITDQGKELMNAINERMQLCKNSSEEDYSYISFDKSRESTVPEPFPKYSVVGDKKSVARLNSTEKPPPPQKPAIYKAELNGKVVSSKPTPLQSSKMQPKMSEVLSQMPQQNVQNNDDGVYGYSHLDLKGATPKANSTADLENPYGEQLVQKIKNSK